VLFVVVTCVTVYMYTLAIGLCKRGRTQTQTHSFINSQRCSHGCKLGTIWTFENVRLCAYLFVCLSAASKTNDPKVFKLGVWTWDILEVTWFWDWKVNGQGHRVSNTTQFKTTIVAYSHSLGGDTDKSNTMWVSSLSDNYEYSFENQHPHFPWWLHLWWVWFWV